MLIKKWALLLPCLLFVLRMGYPENLTAQNQKSQLESLVKNSDLIVIGKVVEKRSEWNEKKTRIYTNVTISVDVNLKGEIPEKSITVTHLGGEIGEVGELYSHTPKFIEEEEVVVFAKRDKENKLIVTKGAEGKFNVSKDEITGEKKVGAKGTLKEFATRIKSIAKE